jgi:molecular chaperone GrpE
VKKGSFTADIPADAIAEAMRSVEKPKQGEAGEVTIEIEGAIAAAESESPADEAPPDAELESLRAQLELSQQKGREMLEKLREEHEKLLRAAADLDNYKKRSAKERAEIEKFGTERLLKDMLPVVDNLDRALAHAQKDDPLAGGVKMVLKQLEDVLGRNGVKGFSAMGQMFDPARHEAMQQVLTQEQPPGTVVMEHARGFTLHDRLVRPAMVGVAAAPPAVKPETKTEEKPAEAPAASADGPAPAIPAADTKTDGTP